jgi:hypothetical protein
LEWEIDENWALAPSNNTLAEKHSRQQSMVTRRPLQYTMLAPEHGQSPSEEDADWLIFSTSSVSLELDGCHGCQDSGSDWLLSGRSRGKGQRPA